MSVLSSLEDTTKEFFSSSSAGAAGVSIDIGKVIDVVNAIVSAAPAIEQGIASATPFVEAIITLIKNGGAPTDVEWASLKAALDSNSAILANAEAQAQSELNPTPAPIDPPAALDPALPVSDPSPNVGEAQ